MISFFGAIKLGFQRYSDFDGRSTRAEYWWWLLMWLVFWLIIPLIVLLLWAAKHGDKETNRFGPVPEIGGMEPD